MGWMMKVRNSQDITFGKGWGGHQPAFEEFQDNWLQNLVPESTCFCFMIYPAVGGCYQHWLDRLCGGWRSVVFPLCLALAKRCEAEVDGPEWSGCRV